MTYTLQQLQQMGATPVTSPTPVQGANYTQAQLQQMGAQPVDSSPSIPSQIMSNLGSTFQKGGQNVMSAISDVPKNTEAAGNNELAATAAVGTAAGHIAGAIAQTAGGIVGSLVSPFLPQPVKDSIGNVSQFIDDKIKSIPGMTPEIHKGLGDVFNTVSLLGGAKTEPIAKEAIAGVADTASAGVTNAVDTIKKTVSGISSSGEDVIAQRINALQKLEDNSSPLRKIVANSGGVDVKKLVADTDLLQGSVDDTGTIRTKGTGEAVDQFNKFMSQYESAVSDGLVKEGKIIPLSDIENTFNQALNKSKVAGSGKVTLTNLFAKEIDGLKLDADANGNIPLSKLQDAKISTTNNIDYNNPASKLNAKEVGSIYKKIIEKNSSLDVKGMNAELSKFYKIGDYLEALDGKKVAGGKLGKYFAQTVGAMAGSHFGPLGTIIGSEIAGKIKGFNLSATFGPEIGSGLEASGALKDLVKANASGK